jgi:hypothetical protein
MKAILVPPSSLQFDSHNLFIYPRLIASSLIVAIVRRQEEFCKCCGSEDITDYIYESRIKQGLSIDPTVDLGAMDISDQSSIVPFRVNSLLHYDDTEETAGKYATRICKICGNINISTANVPLRVAIDEHEIVLMPYMLYFVLRMKRYEDTRVEEIILGLWIRELRRIKDRWIRNHGVNPCCDGRRGFKTTLRLDGGLRLELWVLLDTDGDDLIYRLNYGGLKTCR